MLLLVVGCLVVLVWCWVVFYVGCCVLRFFDMCVIVHCVDGL